MAQNVVHIDECGLEKNVLHIQLLLDGVFYKYQTKLIDNTVQVMFPY